MKTSEIDDLIRQNNFSKDKAMLKEEISAKGITNKFKMRLHQVYNNKNFDQQEAKNLIEEFGAPSTYDFISVFNNDSMRYALARRIYAGAKHEIKEGNYVDPKLLNFVKKNLREESSNLEKSVATASVISLLASLFFISNNLTGNAILFSSSKLSLSMFIGAGLFILGLVGFLIARKI